MPWRTAPSSKRNACAKPKARNQNWRYSHSTIESEKVENMEDNKPNTLPPDPNAISSAMKIQWQDHFHMRDQSWEVLKYSAVFFVGVVGLQFKVTDRATLITAYSALLITSALGVIVTLHHRYRQKEKFKIITKYEQELRLYPLIQDVLEGRHKTLAGRVNTSTYIVVMQSALAAVAAALLIKVAFF